MKKTIILIILVFIASCRTYTAQELAQWEKEEQRINDCIKAMKIVEEKNITKPYDIINVITTTERNGKEDYIFDYFKRQACEKGGDAIIFPHMNAGPIRTTYAAKIIVWTK